MVPRPPPRGWREWVALLAHLASLLRLAYEIGRLIR